MPQNRLSQQHGMGYETHEQRFQQGNQNFTHEQKLEYAIHEHPGQQQGNPQQNAHIHAYSTPAQTSFTLGGNGQQQSYGQQQQYGHQYQQHPHIQSFQQHQQHHYYQNQQQSQGQGQGQQSSQAQRQQQQMKQRIQQQFGGQYSQLSTKDFNYLKDTMSWELLAAKKCFHYAKECQDPHVGVMIHNLGEMHERHYNTLLQFFDPQNVQ